MNLTCTQRQERIKELCMKRRLLQDCHKLIQNFADEIDDKITDTTLNIGRLNAGMEEQE